MPSDFIAILNGNCLSFVYTSQAHGPCTQPMHMANVKQTVAAGKNNKVRKCKGKMARVTSTTLVTKVQKPDINFTRFLATMNHVNFSVAVPTSCKSCKMRNTSGVWLDC